MNPPRKLELRGEGGEDYRESGIYRAVSLKYKLFPTSEKVVVVIKSSKYLKKTYLNRLELERLDVDAFHGNN